MACINSNRHWTHSCNCFHESSFVSLRDVNKASVISSIVFCLVATVFIILGRESCSYYTVSQLTHRWAQNYQTFCDCCFESKGLKRIQLPQHCFARRTDGEYRRIASKFLRSTEKVKDRWGPKSPHQLYCSPEGHHILELYPLWRAEQISLQEGKKPRMH